MLFIAVVASFAYRRLKHERSKQGGGGGRGGGAGGQSQADADLLVAINSSPPRVARWGS